MKKNLLFLCSVLMLFTSCSAIKDYYNKNFSKKDAYIIAELKQNGSGNLKEPAKAGDVIFKTETGKNVKVFYDGKYFSPNKSAHFTPSIVGYAYSTEKRDGSWKFAFYTKDKNLQLEYVKVDIILPNKAIPIIVDTESMKQSLDKNGIGKEVQVKNNAKAYIQVNDKNYEWTAETNYEKVDKQYGDTFFKEKCFYLIKFTIKAKGMKEEVIYQASALPIRLPYAQIK